jgi:hypothetical protein
MRFHPLTRLAAAVITVLIGPPLGASLSPTAKHLHSQAVVKSIASPRMRTRGRSSCPTRQTLFIDVNSLRPVRREVSDEERVTATQVLSYKPLDLHPPHGTNPPRRIQSHRGVTRDQRVSRG